MRIARCSIALLAAALVPGVLAVAPAHAASKTLLVGVSTPLSGAAAPPGRGTLRAMELSSEDVNAAGGIKVGDDTYRIKLVAYDSKYDTREGVSIANKLIFDDKVHYMVTFGGTVTIAVDPIVNENHVLNFAAAYGGKKATNPNSPYTFRVIPEPEQGYITLMPWIVKKYGVKTIAITSTDDETGLLQAEDSEREAKHLGVTVTDMAYAPRGTLDFTPMMTKLLARKPDAIDFGAWAGSDGPAMCRQTKELGYKGVMIFSYTQSVPTFLKVAPDCADHVLFMHIFATPPTPAAARVAREYEAKYKQKFDPLVWRQYDVMWVLKRAIETAGTIDPARVKDVMRTVQIDSILSGKTHIGGKSYYGIDAQFLYPIPLSTYDARTKTWTELYRGTVPEGY